MPTQATTNTITIIVALVGVLVVVLAVAHAVLPPGLFGYAFWFALTHMG